MAAESGRQAFDTPCQRSGDKPSRLQALHQDLIESLEQAKNGIRQAFDISCQPSACGDKPAKLEAFCHDLIKRLKLVKNEIRKILDTLWQLSACGDKPEKLEAFYHYLIEWLAQVENEIRKILDTPVGPSACGDKPAKLEAFCHDLIKSLEQVENEIRKILDTPVQPSACGDKPAKLEAFYHYLIKSLEQVENEIRLMDRNISDRFDSVETQLQFLESCHRAFSGEMTQKDLNKTEEDKKLKEKIKELEAKNSKLLSKVMSIHKNSENMNDPFRLSAVLEMYEMLRLHNWEKFRTVYSLTYKSGSKIIKKLFDACEKDIQQRTTTIFRVLGIPPSNDVMTNSKQEVMQEMRNLFRYFYNQNDSEIYHNIIALAGPFRKLSLLKLFADLSMREQN